jgi:thiol-disulfide isomerase/thioredoxin
VAARAATAEAQRIQALDTSPQGALAALPVYDQALAILKDQPPAQRVPVYTLRIAAMERGGIPATAIREWMLARSSDTAAIQALETALTAGQKQVGTRAPALKLPRIDGSAGLVDIAAFAGKPVLVDFFATWCKPCQGAAAAIANAAKRYADRGLVTIGVSLDTKDSVRDLPAWLARYGIAYPVVGEKAGWDGETDDAWHVDAIPCLILIGPDGTVVANDLIGDDPGKLAENLGKLLERVLTAPGDAAQDGPPGDPVPTKPDQGGTFIP